MRNADVGDVGGTEVTDLRKMAAVLAVLASCAIVPASDRASGAEIVVSINKATQNMSVLVDGIEKHNWVISTGTGGGPPSGSYRPLRLEKKWFSHKYGWSPMPNAVFFHEGYAIHGTIYISRLGRRASHGCVRLHPDNAAILFELVRLHGKINTQIVISNTAHVAARVMPTGAVVSDAIAPPLAAPAYVEPSGQGAP